MNCARTLAAVTVIAAGMVAACNESQLLTEAEQLDVVMSNAPEACAEWSCDPWVCGHETLPPNHACCVKSIYEWPGSYAEPLPTEPEPNCAVNPPIPDDMPSHCERGDCQYGGPTLGCQYNGMGSCEFLCSFYEDSCWGAKQECEAEPGPWCDVW